MKMNRAGLTCATALAGLFAGTGISRAQEAQQGEAVSVNDIVVTARKRTELARDVPVAITALSSEVLEQKNITNVVDLTVTVPNLTYSTASTQPQLFIRGVGSGTNEGFDQSVAKFVNNVYFGAPHDAKVPVFDVERVEVLKGPQVITFGNSATAGALNITTIAPGKSFSAKGSVAYDFESNEVKAQGGADLPLADWASLRLAGYFQDLGRGENYNALLDRHEIQSRSWAFRPTLKLEPSSDLTVVLTAEYDYFWNQGAPYQVIRQPLVPTAPRYPEADDPGRNDQNYNRGPVNSDQYMKQRGGLLMADIRYDALGGQFVSTTAYRAQRNLIQLGLPGPDYNMTFFQHDLQKFNQFSQELRFFGSYGAFDISVGGYYENSNRHINYANGYLFGGFGSTGNVGLPTQRVMLYDQGYDKYSTVIDGTWRIGGGFSLSAGVRYSRYEKNAGQEVFGADYAPDLGFNTTRDYLRSYRTAAADARLPLFGATPHVFAYGSLKLRENQWQPQAIFQYKFGDQMAYIKYVKGAKAGGFDSAYGSANPNNIAFDSENGAAFEAGLKGATADRSLDYSLIGFRETFSGLQQSFLVGTSFLVTNAGKARSQGIELELNYRPLEGLRLGFNGSYLDAKFLDYPNAPCSTEQVAATPSGCRQDRSGTPLQFASKWTGSFSVDYEQPVASYIVGGGVSVFARSKFNAGAVNDPGAVQAGFAMIDGHLDLKPDAGWWTLSMFVRNLTDKRYLNYVVAPPGNSTALLSGYERGRQVGLRLGVDF